MNNSSFVKDNRSSYRYEPAQSEVRLGWWDEPDFRSVPAELRNISHGGAMMLTDGRPDPGKPLWVCMSNRAGADWAEAAVVSTGQVGPDGRREVRLKFVESCPYEMFSLAVHGISVGT